MAFKVPFLDEDQFHQLRANGHAALDFQARLQDFDPLPVVKLFTPDADATWLLTEIDPRALEIAFGLCDLGVGFPEIGYVSLRELCQVRGALALPIEQDRHFRATQRLSTYAKEARLAGRIQA